MSKQSAAQMLAANAKRAGIGKAVSAHWLRHCLAPQALAAAALLLQVQKGSRPCRPGQHTALPACRPGLGQDFSRLRRRRSGVDRTLPMVRRYIRDGGVPGHAGGGRWGLEDMLYDGQ